MPAKNHYQYACKQCQRLDMAGKYLRIFFCYMFKLNPSAAEEDSNNRKDFGGPTVKNLTVQQWLK